MAKYEAIQSVVMAMREADTRPILGPNTASPRKACKDMVEKALRQAF